MLLTFWHSLRGLPDLANRKEHLLCAELVADLRRIVTDMVLAQNGISRPKATRNLNAYLSLPQRQALKKTLQLPSVSSEGWIGQSVALVVIYRWYAPQLVSKYGLAYPSDAESEALGLLAATLPDWPRSITTE